MVGPAALRLFDLADDLDTAVVETHFPEMPGDRDALRDADVKLSCLATGQDDLAVQEPGGLIREEHLAVSELLVRVLEGLAALAKRFGRSNRLAEIIDGHLHRLRMQVRKLAFGCCPEIALVGPCTALLTDVGVVLNQPGPESIGFHTDRREGLPLRLRLRKPVDFYSAVNHASSIRTTTRKASGIPQFHIQGRLISPCLKAGGFTSILLDQPHLRGGPIEATIPGGCGV